MLIMIHEIPQTKFDAAWSILQSEGVYKLPKRTLVIPQPILKIVANIVGKEYVPNAFDKFQAMQDFLHQEPIADRFGQNHGARRKWLGEMRTYLGVEVLGELYENRNQLRLGLINDPVLALVNLQRLIKVPQGRNILERIKEINQLINKVFSGYNSVTGEQDGNKYNDRDLDGKLEVVRFMEDRCIDTLGLFTE